MTRVGLWPGQRGSSSLLVEQEETGAAIPLGETCTKMTRFVITMGSGLFACLLSAHCISSCSCVYLHFAGFNWGG